MNGEDEGQGYLDFGRGICDDLRSALSREWLITNGIGGYASGTVAGALTRRYHGLLIAALHPPLGRTLLLTKLDETAVYDGRMYPLFTNVWADGVTDPRGYLYLERFRLEGTIPVWTCSCADALLEKRIWMQPGVNTTYIRYHLRRASQPMTLTLRALVNYRSHHGNTHAGNWTMQVEPIENGLRIRAADQAVPFLLLSEGGRVRSQHEWYRNFFLGAEEYRGLDPYDDNLAAGTFHASLEQGESVTVVASSEMSPSLNGAEALRERQAYEGELLVRSGLLDAPPAIRQLVMAADQFIIRRRATGRSVLAGYPWLADWERDMMVSLPGLTLVTGRQDVAREILRTYANVLDQGMLPNRFSDNGGAPEYGSVDASLWFVEAMRAYYAATGDIDMLRELFPALREIIDWYMRGTRHDIRMDPEDGLLASGNADTQLTWMNAKVGDWVVTPRYGKAVEVNALWYNALQVMADFAERVNEPAETYRDAAGQARAGFARFWNQEMGYCYDVLDCHGGPDARLRPNQLLAISLPHSPLYGRQARSIVEHCVRHLYTSHGLRTLSMDAPDYVGRYGGNQRQRDAAYHEGTAWSWLIGPFIIAHLKVYRDPASAATFLWPLVQNLKSHGVGSISEIFDGDPPFTPRGCIAQAWGVAEVLRAWQAIQTMQAERQKG